jgi:pyruvate kinase
LVKGETLILTTDYEFKGDSTKIACSYKGLPTSVKVGQQILAADGSLVLTVLSCNPAAGEVSCRIENNAAIGERKNMNLPGVSVDLPVLMEKDISDIQDWGIKNGVDFIAASFVQKASDVLKIREVLGEKGKNIKIICKIENLEGLENYDAILDVTDGVSTMTEKETLRNPSSLLLTTFCFSFRRSWLPVEIWAWKFLLKRFSWPRR